MRWKRCVILWMAGVCALSLFAAAAPTTIADAVDLALEHHSELRQAELTLRLAELELDATLAVYTLPSLSLTVRPPEVTVDGLDGNLAATLGGSLSLPFASSSQVSGSLNLAWDVDDAAWDASGWALNYSQSLNLAQSSTVSDQVERARDAVDDAESALAAARNGVILATIEAYSGLLSDAAAIARATEALARAEDELASVQALAEEGLRGSTALSQAQLDALDARIRLETLTAAYERDLAAFARESLGVTEPIELTSFELALDVLRADAELLVAWDDPIDEAVDASSSVLAAIAGVEDAEDALAAALREVLPNVTVEAGYTSQGWVLGGSIEFDFFAPDRADQIEIARVSLQLAEEKLAAAREAALDGILRAQAALEAAVDDLDRLALETERWALEEEILAAKRASGAIAEDEWAEFLESKDAFELDALGREVTLLVAYLEYRDALGFDLDWKDWLT